MGIQSNKKKEQYLICFYLFDLSTFNSVQYNSKITKDLVGREFGNKDFNEKSVVFYTFRYVFGNIYRN